MELWKQCGTDEGMVRWMYPAKRPVAKVEVQARLAGAHSRTCLLLLRAHREMDPLGRCSEV